MRCLLITTVKDEGPSILEWIAHHKRIGFDDIVVYQNDSTDMMPRTLATLDQMGVIRYFDNSSKRVKGGWQPIAYTRASKLPLHSEADWAIALDGDEYLSINTPEGTVQSLIEAVCNEAPVEPDVIRLNWKIFGSGFHRRLSPDLVTSRYTKTEWNDRISTNIVGFKTLYRTSVFTRPGVHNPSWAVRDDWVEANGSGLPLDAYRNAGWRSTDPGLRRFAQVNHYMVRSASDYLVKCARGRSSNTQKTIRLRYWRNANMNDDTDTALADQADDLAARMAALDEQSGGKLMRFRARSFQMHRKQVRAALDDPEWRALYDKMIGVIA